MLGSAGIVGYGAAPRAAVAALALLLVTVLAHAESAGETPVVPPAAPDDAANGRFAMTPVADGFLRLDTRTGQVSLCSVASGQVQCRAGADERAALEAEIDRLAKENARLKAAAPPAGPNAQDDEEDRRFDRALDRAERFMRRMLQLFRDSGAKPPSNL